MEELQKAIAYLEELQECQKRPLKHGIRDTQDLLDGLDWIILGLKQIQLDLQKENDHRGNCSH